MPAGSMRQEHESLQIKGAFIFSIFQLPTEVRQKIWKSVMIFDEPIIVEPHGRIRSAPSHLRSGKQVKMHIIEQEQQRFSSQFALASSCRQVYLEVAPIYYGLNTFKVISKDLIHFLKAIGPENVRSIHLIQWSLLKLDYTWIPRLSLYLDDEGLPALHSLCVCLEILSERRVRAPFCSSELQVVLRSHPWLGAHFPEHGGRVFCHTCAVSLPSDTNQLLKALQHLLDLKTAQPAF